MKKTAKLLLFLILLGFVINGCATAPNHFALKNAQLPELIPLRDFFINKESSFGYQVSPDGLKLAWIAVDNRKLTIYFKTIREKDVTVINTHSARSIYGFAWVQDSRRMLFLQDQAGNGNYHIYLADSARPDQKPVDLTPFDETRAWIHQILRSNPEHILIGHNRRDKSVDDLYRVNLDTGEQDLIAQNPGDVLTWISDDDGALRARIRKLENEERILEVLQYSSNSWKQIISWDLEESVQFLSFTSDNKGMWLKSNVARDRIGLVRLDLETGKQSLIYEDPRVDLELVSISYLTKEPMFAASFPDYPKLHFFDKEVEELAEPFLTRQPVNLYLTSSNNSETIFTVAAYTDKGGEYFLFNRNTRQKELLNRHPISVYHDALADMEPISFQSRDGLTLHGYLTRPTGTNGRMLPTVIFVHGGPWYRDYWNYQNTVQFLANRGYAVLQINFRGSTGYGRAFKEAAVGEFAGKMNDDLNDGAQWLIDQSISDPVKIGIFGFSYGGYATLVGLTFTPDTFACGVDVSGMSNLVTLLESSPKYWKNQMPFFYKYMGDPNNPADRQKMEASSPLFRLDQIKRPLLIVQGANDVIVPQRESDQIVSALRKANKAVVYILFSDEGHGISNWKNRLTFSRKLEDFLAEHLGGRSGGFDLYELWN